MNFPVSKKFLCYIFFLPYKTIQARQILRSHHVHHIVRTKVHHTCALFPSPSLPIICTFINITITEIVTILSLIIIRILSKDWPIC